MKGLTLERRSVWRRLLLRAVTVLPVLLNGCLMTPQSARIYPGPRVDVMAVRLSDQERRGRAQQADYLAAFGLVYGFGSAFEVGFPIGFYWHDGLGGEKSTPVLLPYAKVALLPDNSATHLALSLQFGVFFPANLGVHVSRDLGSWEAQLGITAIGNARFGDGPATTRFEEREQSMVALTIGVTWLDRPRRPSIQAGLLRNRYNDGTGRRSFYDLFVGLSLSFG